MSVDPVTITPERKLDPQQLNRYAYVRNNPFPLVDPNGEILECNGTDKDACLSVLQQIAGDLADRLSMDTKTRLVSFDTTGLDLSQNEGATLVNQTAASSETYGFALADIANTAAGPVKLSNDPVSNLDNRTDVRYPKGKSPTDLPAKGVADQVTIDPKTAHFLDSQGRPVSLSSLAFHELAEAYGKIDEGKQYVDFQKLNIVNGNTVQIGLAQRGAHHEGCAEGVQASRDSDPTCKAAGALGTN